MFDRYGPRPCLIIGAVLSLVGYTGTWAGAGRMVRGRVTPLPTRGCAESLVHAACHVCRSTRRCTTCALCRLCGACCGRPRSARQPRLRRRNNGAAFLDGTVVPLAMKNFPRNRGIVAGVLKSTFGLSASVLTTIYTGFFSPATTPFLLFIGIFVCAVSLISLRCAQVRWARTHARSLAAAHCGAAGSLCSFPWRRGGCWTAARTRAC